MGKTTHIRVPLAVKEKLAKIGKDGESIGDTIRRLVEYYESGESQLGKGAGIGAVDNSADRYKAFESRINALESISGVDTTQINNFAWRVTSLERYVEKEFEAIKAVSSVIEKSICTEEIPEEISVQIKKLTHIVTDVTTEMDNIRRFVALPINSDMAGTEGAKDEFSDTHSDSGSG